MSKFTNQDWLTQVKLGNIPGHRLIHKFGRNSAVGTSYVPIAVGGVYQTPPTNQTLEFVSDDANDTSAGTGAQKVFVQGAFFSGGVLVAQEEEIITNGTTAVALVNSYARVFRMWISESGTYADVGTVSSPGTLTIQATGGGAKWIEIDEFTTGNSAGQSQTALYTTPTATTSILYSPTFSIDATKTGNIILFQRPNADDVTTPFTGARRIIQQWDGIDAPDGSSFLVPFSKFTGAVDIGFMARVAIGTGSISAEFWLLEIDD